MNTTSLPSLADLVAAKAAHHQKTIVSIRDFLNTEFGIVNKSDLDAFVAVNAKIVNGGRESKYDVLVRKMGVLVADKVMRQLETLSW